MRSDVLASAAAAAEEAGGGARVRARARDAPRSSPRRTAPSVREVDEAQIEHDAKRNGGIPDPRARSPPPDVFAALGKTGSAASYLRAPVAARAAPGERQFERVVSRLTFRGRGCRAGIRV